MRNKALRYWIDNSIQLKIDRFTLNKYSTELRHEFKFVKDLNSMAVQSAAERARKVQFLGSTKIVRKRYQGKKDIQDSKKIIAQPSTKPLDGLCI